MRTGPSCFRLRIIIEQVRARCKIRAVPDMWMEPALDGGRFRRAPEGLCGVGPGSTGQCRSVGVESVFEMPSKGKVALLRDDVIELSMGGEAGYGDPALRPVARVAADRLDGSVT